MCSSQLNPLDSNNFLFQGTRALATGAGIKEVLRLGKKLVSTPSPPPLPDLPPPPAALKTPEIPRRRNNSSTGPVAASPNNTVLTGALGIDPATQNVGRTLLGGA